MLSELLSKLQRRPVPACTVAIYVVCTAIMAWLRIGPSGNHVINIDYGIPLLVCLWYPERRLLWSLVATFALMAAYKLFVSPSAWVGDNRFVIWSVQMFNMVMIAMAVHLVIYLTNKLRRQKAELEGANHELLVREEEISHQNEELQSQSEELAQQNEEVHQQADELQAQAEALHLANSESTKRQAILQALLDSLKADDSRDLPGRICHLLMSLLGEPVSAAVVLEKEGDEMVVLAQAGPVGLSRQRWAYDKSFASVVMTHDRTACVPDLRLRPDLEGAQSGSRMFLSVLATPLRLGGKPAGVVKVFSTHEHEWTQEQFQIIEWMSAQCSMLMDSRRLQVELQRANADLDRLVKERTAELQDLVNELEHFSYTITHDLRAPLRAMHGFAGLLSEECMSVLNQQSREYLARITTAASRMDRLITDALSYSKVVRNEMPMESVDLGRLLRGMVDSYPNFQEPNAHIEIAADLPLVLGNEAGLTQCFSNLLGNAVKFVARGKVPVVRVRGELLSDGRVRVWCEDNGIGIPKDLQSRVFVMFQRLSKDYEGTGIGLTLVKKVVERMGGAVGLESEPANGSRFWIELRAADSTR